MSDDALNRFGKSARYMCSSAASHGTESTFKTYKMRMAVRICLPEYVRRITGTATQYRGNKRAYPVSKCRECRFRIKL